MNSVDTILHARWILPVNDSNTVLNDHSIIIDDGRITHILPSQQARQDFSAGIEKT